MKKLENKLDLKLIIENETGLKFNRENKICCPFHHEKTPSFSIRFNANKGKEQYKCFGCGAIGDAIDFIKEYKGFNYIEAKEYLGMPTEKTISEQLEDKVKGYINWQIYNQDFRKDNKLLGLFRFVDSNNNTLYFKAKFLKPDGKKDISYYHIENDKVKNSRGCDEVPYNLYDVLQGIKEDKTIIITEGEKDSNLLNHMLFNYDYVTTSIKGCKDLTILKGAKIFVCSDTGEAGEKYKWEIRKELFSSSKIFKTINLPGIEELGDNKDVTDWIQSGHSKKDLFEAFERSLDLKNKHELQQDRNGIYKTVFKEKGEDIKEIKIYLTNFQVIKAISINYVDKDINGIKVICKTSNGKIFEKIKEVSVFDDVKSFRNFLGSMELTYEGDLKDLILLKKWINRYYIFNNICLYDNSKFKYIDNKLCFITDSGILSSEQIDLNNKSGGNFNIDVINIDPINKNELESILQQLFNFSTKARSYSIIGTIINNLAVAQAIEIERYFHHLLIVGESGSGKTTILTKVIAPILNYPKRIQSIGLITPFAMIKEISSGNYPILFDEFKPSTMDKYKIDKISDILRNVYDRPTVSRGNKTLTTKDFRLERPVIIAGEESYPNQEKANIERSCIVYLSKNERTKKQTEAMEYLSKNEKILNKLGRSLIDAILNLSVEEYAAIRDEVSNEIKKLKDRPSNTAINICTGIEILNRLLKSLELPAINDYAKEVERNISIEVLEDGQETHSIVEQMLILYNEIIEDGRIEGNIKNIVQYREEGLFIRTSEMLTQMRMHIKNTNLDMKVLSGSDFKKQAEKAGYLLKVPSRQIKVNGVNKRFDSYDSDKFKKLKLDAIVQPECVENEWDPGEKEKVMHINFYNQ